MRAHPWLEQLADANAQLTEANAELKTLRKANQDLKQEALQKVHALEVELQNKLNFMQSDSVKQHGALQNRLQKANLEMWTNLKKKESDLEMMAEELVWYRAEHKRLVKKNNSLVQDIRDRPLFDSDRVFSIRHMERQLKEIHSLCEGSTWWGPPLEKIHEMSHWDFCWDDHE